MKNLKSVEHIWSLVCKNSSIDNETNNITLFNLIERITMNAPKQEIDKIKNGEAKGILLGMDFEVVSRFKKLDKSKTTAFDFRLRFLAPSGKLLPVQAEQKIAFTEGIQNMRVRNRFSTMPIIEAGEYTISVEAKDVGESDYQEVAKVPLEIMINSQENKAEIRKVVAK